MLKKQIANEYSENNKTLSIQSCIINSVIYWRRNYLNQYKRFFKTILIMGLMVPLMTHKVSAEDYSVTKRIAGNTRVETSIEASKAFYSIDNSPNVVLAGYHGEIDALTGTLLASSLNAPLLLVDQFENIESELIRLGAKNVYLLGGAAVINNSIEKELRSAGYHVNRIDGKNRFETAVAIANEAVGNTNHVFLTNDGITGSIIDALAIGPVSGMYLSPILLTGKDLVPEQTMDALHTMGVNLINIIGGINAISLEVELYLEDEGFQVERIAGDNRWETAEKIADFYFSPGAAIIANDGISGSLADALVSGHIGAKVNMPLVLTGKNSLNSYTENYLLKSSHLRYVLGGESVLSNKVFGEIVKTEGKTIKVDTEEQVQKAKYDFAYLDVIPKGEEVIAEFARNGKSVTTYKSVKIDDEIIEDIRVHTKWLTHSENGLIYIGTGKDLSAGEGPIIPYAGIFERSGWITSDFIIQEGKIQGFSQSGQDKAKNEFLGLALVLPAKDNNGQAIHTVTKEAFKDYYFQRVSMPDTIKDIQDGAFENMSIIYTKFPTKLETIGKNAFSVNGFSKRVHFNSLGSLTDIGDDAFNFAFFGEGPYKINLGTMHSLKSIGKGAFVGNRIQSVILPEGLVSIGPDAFIYNLIDQVYLPSSLEYIDNFAFDEDVLLIK